MKKKLVAILATGIVSTTAMAQGFDPAAEATSATTTLGTVFGIVFALAVSLVVGFKVISYLRRA